MSVTAMILIALIAALHLYITWFEMFAWTSRGPKVFREFPEDLFEPTTAMAGNQGLYNGFLAAGLIWSLLISTPDWAVNIATFFLLCIVVAGIYGAMTASKRIIYVQTIPAALALLALYI
jgi:putative membrane protein